MRVLSIVSATLITAPLVMALHKTELLDEHRLLPLLLHDEEIKTLQSYAEKHCRRVAADDPIGTGGRKASDPEDVRHESDESTDETRMLTVEMSTQRAKSVGISVDQYVVFVDGVKAGLRQGYE
ncbi:hypothetical protein ARMGADRAFT_1022923 [Armillaria gallica]|uniref:Uncharacterized protein n=1 Tax=Armillaria gallica TaxID=47427 RepID=A0A2H3EN00_ARMGA|nr:hypothetical protein ARMGADRAFT_1022923 [Armillaria gallica]